MKRTKLPKAVLVAALKEADKYRHPPEPTPQYTLHEGGDWHTFPDGTRDVDLLRCCKNRHRVLGETLLSVPCWNYWDMDVHSVKLRNGDVFDAENLMVRREMVLSRLLRNIVPLYYLPQKYNKLLGIRPHSLGSRMMSVGYAEADAIHAAR